MKDLRFSILLNDQYSSKLKSIARGSERSFSEIQTSLRNTGKLGTNLDSLNRKLDFLEKRRRMSVDISDMKNITREIRSVNREIDLIERKSGMRRERAGVAGIMKGTGGLIAGTAIVGGGVALGSEIVETTAKYEKYYAVLKNTYQNGTKAAQSLDDISKFAAQTPFQIDELTDSFIKLENAGFKPTISGLTQIGDLAASRGKTFGQLTEAILDAQMGEFERLKEFGIKGSTDKNTYKFTFKGETTEIKKSADAVKDYILSLGKLQGVQGGMSAISKTTGGAISNLADSWDQLKNAMGSANSGPVKDAVSGLTSLVSKAKQWFSVPTSEKLMQEKAGLNALVSSITSYNVSSDERMSLLNQLKEQYPDFLGKLDAETVSNGKLLQQLDAVNASYEKRINLQAQTEALGAKKDLLKEAETQRDEATMMLELVKQARTGDEGALKAVNERLSFLQKAEIGWRSIGVFDLSDMGKTNLDLITDEYTGQLENSRKEIALLKSSVKMSSGKQRSAEISAFLDEAKNKFVYMPDEIKGKMKKTDLNRIEELFKELDYTSDEIEKFGSVKSLRGAKVDIGARAELMTAELKKLLGYEDVTAPVSKSIGGRQSSGLGSGVENISGDNRIAKNLTINISELGNNMQIITNTIKESPPEIKKMILDALLAAVNDVNAA